MIRTPIFEDEPGNTTPLSKLPVVQAGYDFLHIFRKRRFKMHGFPCPRMDKIQRLGMEGLPLYGEWCFHGRLFGISHQRIPQILHMQADLMGTPGL